MSAVALKRPPGRPSRFSDEIADEICRRISLGESLISVTRDPAMPSERSVYDWLASRPQFSQKYTRAREAQAEHWADQMIEMTDSLLPRDGRVADHAEVQAMRLAVDTRKWLLSKLLPKKYGDRVGLEASGSVTVKVVQGLGEE